MGAWWANKSFVLVKIVEIILIIKHKCCRLKFRVELRICFHLFGIISRRCVLTYLHFISVEQASRLNLWTRWAATKNEHFLYFRGSFNKTVRRETSSTTLVHTFHFLFLTPRIFHRTDLETFPSTTSLHIFNNVDTRRTFSGRKIHTN